MKKWLIIFLWTMLVLAITAVAGCFWAIAEGKIGYMPPIEDLQNPINRYATQVYSADGRQLGTWSLSRENRVMVDYSDISPWLIKALVATEDIRFYEHSGIDFFALGRAIVKRGLMGQRNAGGGSTITQQLAKQLFTVEVAQTTTERALQKPIEWVIAVKLERNYTKDEIISMYLNYFDFLHNAVGIKTASNTYFSKEPSELSITESATLIGLCKNPSYYNPVRYGDRCLERRNVVLGQMLKAEYITQAEYDSCSQVPLNLKFHVSDHKDGSATYFRDFLRRYMTAHRPIRENYPEWNYVKYFIDSINWEQDPLYGWCNKNTKRDGTNYNIYTDGLKVYTTIDSRMQQYAEQACYDHVVGFLQPEFSRANQQKRNPPYSNTLSAADVQRILMRNVRQSERYRVLKEERLSDEAITQSFNTRTPMRVFTFNGEVDTVMTPMDSIRYYKSFLRTIVAGNPWTPRNGSRARYGEMVTLKWGLQQSNNWISAYLMMHRLTPEGFVELLHNYGIRNPEIHPSPALCLGPCEITVAEMVSAYSAFVNHGIRSAPMYVTRITDNEGNLLAEFKPRMNEVISGESADKMLYMLRAVVDGGTAGRLRHRYNITAPLGGKTGTTNSNSDAWFMGVSPKLVTGCWVGGDDRDIHFESMTYGQGASAALPIFALYMKSLYNDPTLNYAQTDQFDFPDDFDPCHGNGFSDDDMGITSESDGENTEKNDIEIIEELFE